MPDWQADAIILSVRPHGRERGCFGPECGTGRHAGLVRGGGSKRLRGTVQPGNRVRASWRARLTEQLGQMNLELTDSVPALLLDSPLRLAGVSAFCALLDSTLPEREMQPALFAASQALLNLIKMDDTMPLGLRV